MMEVNKQPKIKIKRSGFQKLLDLLVILSMGAAIIYIILEWSNLPAQVPTHYNLLGEPDAWGSKGMIWVPLII